jgi:hypothetical protein
VNLLDGRLLRTLAVVVKHYCRVSEEAESLRREVRRLRRQRAIAERDLDAARARHRTRGGP